MTDLTDLSSVSGDELDEATIRGILAQIDLDVTNLLRDGKVAAGRYSTAGRTTDRAASLREMLRARRQYQRLLDELPAVEVSEAESSDE